MLVTYTPVHAIDTPSTHVDPHAHTHTHSHKHAHLNTHNTHMPLMVPPTSHIGGLTNNGTLVQLVFLTAPILLTHLPLKLYHPFSLPKNQILSDACRSFISGKDLYFLRRKDGSLVVVLIEIHEF